MLEWPRRPERGRAPTSTGSSRRPRRSATSSWPAQRDEIQRRLRRADLGATSRPRTTSKLRRPQPQARRDGRWPTSSTPRRLRGVDDALAASPRGDGDRRTTRSSPPGTRSPRCRPRVRAGRRTSGAGCWPPIQEGPEGDGRASAGRPRGARRRAAGQHGRGRRAVRRPVRARSSRRQQRRQAATALPEPEWESLRLALHGPDGPLTIPDDRRLAG